jgi:hypothetical protein
VLDGVRFGFERSVVMVLSPSDILVPESPSEDFMKDCIAFAARRGMGRSRCVLPVFN